MVLRPVSLARVFLSTPSARRATCAAAASRARPADFYPRPPRGGRPGGDLVDGHVLTISIHALREEGDGFIKFLHGIESISIHALREEGDVVLVSLWGTVAKFLSTPSARRATLIVVLLSFGDVISIHALREEGDPGKHRAVEG